ncbi:MAG: hypothetical protein LBG16_04935, partial [Elusimicrobiota bacterium]|nr:hypothetical protein [Elusimicrobiota bacterium]
MKYRLGIDLGTSSIGVAAYSLNENNKIQNLEYLDSYIFGEPVYTSQGKQLKTLNSQRRTARLARRQIERRANRLKKLGYIAQSIGVSKEDVNKISGDKVHELRAKAISEKLTLPEFIKVLFHIVKNRGYKGDLKILEKLENEPNDENENNEQNSKKKKQKKGIAGKIENTKTMLSNSGLQTL